MKVHGPAVALALTVLVILALLGLYDLAHWFILGAWAPWN